MITIENNGSSFANGQSFRIPKEVFKTSPSANMETARVIAVVPDDIDLTENSYFVINCGYNKIDADDSVALRTVNGPVNSWLHVYERQMSSAGVATYIKITKDGYIYSYSDITNDYYYYNKNQDLIITVYDEIPEVLTDVTNYQPDFTKITATANPITTIFKSKDNLNLQCSFFDHASYSTRYRNRIYLNSPIPSQPLTIKLTFSLDSSVTWYDIYDSATLILVIANEDETTYCDSFQTPPQPGETKTYTFTLSDANWGSYFYIGFYSNQSDTYYNQNNIQLYLQQIEILQDISLNGSFPPNKEELITTIDSTSSANKLYNQVHIFGYNDVYSGDLVENTI